MISKTTSSACRRAFSGTRCSARGYPDPDANGTAATVALLGRYRHTAPDNLTQLQQTWKRSGLSVEFLTAHGSKGQERDFIVVLGLEAGEYGFPSNVADDPIMHMVLSRDENFAYAEERRLFYVAMTRARRRVYLIAPQDNDSPFVVDDLLGDALRPYVATIGEVSVRHRCPKCRGQTIRRTERQYGAFWACSHYPLCDGKLNACPLCREGGLVAQSGAAGGPGFQCVTCQTTVEGCPRCRKGYLLQRHGKYGAFLACSRWSGGDGCTYTRNQG